MSPTSEELITVTMTRRAAAKVLEALGTGSAHLSVAVDERRTRDGTSKRVEELQDCTEWLRWLHGRIYTADTKAELLASLRAKP